MLALLLLLLQRLKASTGPYFDAAAPPAQS